MIKYKNVHLLLYTDRCRKQFHNPWDSWSNLIPSRQRAIKVRLFLAVEKQKSPLSSELKNMRGCISYDKFHFGIMSQCHRFLPNGQNHVFHESITYIILLSLQPFFILLELGVLAVWNKSKSLLTRKYKRYYSFWQCTRYGRRVPSSWSSSL